MPSVKGLRLTAKDGRTYRLYTRPGDKQYYIAYTENQRTRLEKTGCETEEDAAAALRQHIDLVNEAVRPDGPTVGDILDMYVLDREQAKIASIRTVKWTAESVKKHLGLYPADKLRPSHCRQFSVKRMAEGGVGPATTNRELTTLAAAMNFARNEGLITNPLKVPKPAPPAPKDRWLTPEEIQKVLNATKDNAPHLFTYVLVAVSTAARPGSILQLTWDHVDFTRQIIDFGEGDGKKSRGVVPMNDRLAEHLREVALASQSGHVIEFRGKPVQWINKGLASAAARAGIEFFSPHDLRRTAASLMLQGGMPISVVSRMLAHKNTAITERVYAKHTVDYLRPAADMLGGVLFPKLEKESV